MADDADREIENSKESKKELNRDWASLPTDLLCLMLPHLFLGDIKRFHNVCRSWRLTPTLSVQSPVLMSIGNDNTRCKFFHPLYKSPYSMYIPELFGAVPRFCKDGWMLMSRGEHSMFFLNPFTKALINLPDLPDIYDFGGITFTSSPTSSDCMVFGIYVNHDEKFFSISTICRGEESWQVLHGENNSPFFLSHCNPVFHHGEFYCLGQHGNLGVYNPDEDYWTILDKPHRQQLDPFLSHEHNFLVECNGELLSVSLSFMGKSISVSKLDSVEMTWHKVDSLVDQMLFVSNTSSLSAMRVVQGMENKIYLPRVHEKCGAFYSLASRLFQTFGNDFSRKDWYGTWELLSCCWIEPKADTSYSKEELNWFEDA
ncbi:F-box/kelch-repeat protein At1g57790-like [Rhododendron vialii]|uniref:F-box/kelch-repeat protein At1g57790-like n=1 Tax=Rhododendron vialii TaxID=182163 RepID=UPI00265E7301|nr:F-box/kelch-repeat protein At1g57790-like [Rhododendron vialii]